MSIQYRYSLYINRMSSYIIAGSADSLDTAYCQQIARRIKKKYKNIDFRVVIKHPSEWEDYLNQICRIYGFLKKSNPIIYTYHGKIIGNKDAFIDNTVKYFGLSEESLLVSNLSTAVNIKLANEELQRKKAIKNNIKSLTEKIKIRYDKLLKEGHLKHEFKTSSQFLLNGIQYYFRQIPGLCPPISFPENFKVLSQEENITASNLNLMELSLQDQIVPEENGKQPFVTNQNNQVLNTQSMERMSQASRTNKLQSSVMSKDQDSKVNKQSNRQKQKIDEQIDDVPDFNNINMQSTLIVDLGDHFCLAFENKSHIPGEMVLYHNQGQNNGSFIKIFNDRPVIGHHTIIKQIHYIVEEGSQSIHNGIQQLDGQVDDQKKDEEENEGNIDHQSMQKSKTQPNIPESKPHINVDDALSEPCSDLNLISNLNYHTLYILKPLSTTEIRYLIYLLKQTNTAACLQFLPENPNPRLKIYSRGMLLQSNDSLFPVQNFIKKQLEDEEFETVTLPTDWEQHEQIYKVSMLKINELGFTHLYYPHPEKLNEEDYAKALRAGIDEILFLQEKLKKQIGYNLIVTSKYTLIVALTSPYRVYGENNLYFDGLAYLGYVQVAKVTEGYKLKEQKMETGKDIRQWLRRCSSYQPFD